MYVRSQMYHIFKDAASLITMSSENHRLTALSHRVSHFQTWRVNTSKLGELTCSTSLRNIMNIAKIHGYYSSDVWGWCSEKTVSKKKTNQHWTLYLDTQHADFIVKSHIIKDIVVRNCMNIAKYTPTYTNTNTLISFKWGGGGER